ncbi:MAG: phosphoribosylanthranilate isomerase [Saprospiraceae bacterium]|jgi:phosphoribosylanthranilate isomerase|tara:strand:+ start:971 stop:1537 length:567 start_codon:yes stop_codon:yes gene_type:complete
MKIIATDITNLTDARYFAAWGVDMMCYNIDPDTEGSLSIPQFKEITEWVEGPMTGIKISGLAIPETMSAEGLDIKNVIISPFIDKTDLPISVENVYRICTLDEGWQDDAKLILTLSKAVDQLSRDEIGAIKTIATDKEVYLDGIFKANDLANIESFGVTGIILKGGDEEKVGYKSFDELDEVLEALFD